MPVLERQEAAAIAGRATLVAIGVNGALAAVKGVAGILGSSHALVADAVESLADVVASVVVWLGLRVAASRPTERYPFGKGRAETIAALVVALAMFGAAATIVVNAVIQLKAPQRAPAPYTLLVLVLVVLVKEGLFRFVLKVGKELTSTAVKADAWHHRSDALTSLAAFVGISVSLLFGKGYEAADVWASLVAAMVISVNASLLVGPAISELTDAAPDKSIGEAVRKIATGVPGVLATHRCWVRKLGFDHFVELDIVVEGNLSVKQGHDLAHLVQERVRDAMPAIARVMVHVEPKGEYGRQKLDWEK